MKTLLALFLAAIVSCTLVSPIGETGQFKGRDMSQGTYFNWVELTDTYDGLYEYSGLEGASVYVAGSLVTWERGILFQGDIIGSDGERVVWELDTVWPAHFK